MLCFAGTICSGWLSDRFDNRVLLAWYYGLRGLSLLWLPLSNFDIVSSLFAVFFGLDFIATESADGEARGTAFRPGQCSDCIRLVLCEPSGRRRGIRFRQRNLARCLGNLPARLSRDRRGMFAGCHCCVRRARHPLGNRAGRWLAGCKVISGNGRLFMRRLVPR